MSNNSIESSQAADQLLLALGEQLAARGESYTLAVVGGSALLALGLISRPTRDVDILAIVENRELVSAQPLPATLLDAAYWSRSHDPSEGYLSVLKRVLAHFGVDSGNLDP
jgi:hypothetical protein